MTDLRQILASNMKFYRKTLGISQAKLAEMVNITDNYIALRSAEEGTTVVVPVIAKKQNRPRAFN